MRTADLLRDFEDGDGVGWSNEFDLLRTDGWHPTNLYEIARTAARDGIQQPILLGPDNRVWDGHHRLCVAHDLGIEYVPVEYAAN